MNRQTLISLQDTQRSLQAVPGRASENEPSLLALLYDEDDEGPRDPLLESRDDLA